MPGGPFLGDELPMPAQERVGRHHGRDVSENSTPDAMRPHSKLSPIHIGQPKAPATQLPP
jgi:hypothetical protein